MHPIRKHVQIDKPKMANLLYRFADNGKRRSGRLQIVLRDGWSVSRVSIKRRDDRTGSKPATMRKSVKQSVSSKGRLSANSARRVQGYVAENFTQKVHVSDLASVVRDCRDRLHGWTFRPRPFGHYHETVQGKNADRATICVIISTKGLSGAGNWLPG